MSAAKESKWANISSSPPPHRPSSQIYPQLAVTELPTSSFDMASNDYIAGLEPSIVEGYIYHHHFLFGFNSSPCQ